MIKKKKGISKLDFLKKVKNPTKHTAQKVKSKGCLKSKIDRIRNKMSVVMGSFW